MRRSRISPHGLIGRVRSDDHDPVRAILQRYFQSAFLHLDQRLGVSFCVVDRIVSMRSPPQVLEVLERILDHTFVERAEIRAGMPKRISAQVAPKIPVDELPIEAVVVADEERAASRMLREPTLEVFHDPGGLGEF